MKKKCTAENLTKTEINIFLDSYRDYISVPGLKRKKKASSVKWHSWSNFSVAFSTEQVRKKINAFPEDM